VRAYWAMLLAGFRRQATYRLAAATGLVTNAFFGVVRTAIFLALYRQRGQVAGMDLGDALTYVWVLESLFGVIWVAWFWETAESIRSGDFVVELLRPGDLPLRESFDLIGHLYRIPAADRAARLARLCEVLGLGPLLAVPVRSLSLGRNAGRACPTRMRRAC
jgi:ABC-type uncharacterized transport system permease subunit